MSKSMVGKCICLVLIIIVLAHTAINLFITSLDDMIQSKHNNNNHTVVLLTYVDNNGYKRYSKHIKALSCYAKRHGYELIILKKEKYTECTASYKDIFFIKHCIIRLYLETQKSNLIAFVFDADVAVNKMTIPLDKWITESDITFYQRSWNFEITIGNYIIKNTAFSRTFLQLLSEYEFRKPKNAFSSSDNGAVHQLLVEVLGLENADQCDKIYSNLKHDVTNLTEYYSFVACTRLLMGPPRHWILNKNWMSNLKNLQNTVGLTNYYINETEKTKLLPSITILPRYHAWVMDPHFIRAECDNYHVFHHGVKQEQHLIKYGFQFDNKTHYQCPNDTYRLNTKTQCSTNEKNFFESLNNTDVNYIMPAKNMPWSQVPKWYLGDCLMTLSCKPLENDEPVLEHAFTSSNDEMKMKEVHLSFQNDIPQRT